MNQWSAEFLSEAEADRADLSAILAHAQAEAAAGKGALTDLLGLPPEDLRALAKRLEVALPPLAELRPLPQEQADLVTLLRWRSGRAGPEARWLAAILARRAMEQNHLWEDLGLPSRAHLGRLIARHFPRLHAANTGNMRWKRFFYRQICSEGGGPVCLAPHCDDCAEKSVCFAPDGA